MTEAATCTHRRARLWELARPLHCSVVGACLSLSELRAIAGRAGLRFAASASDYDVHGTFAHKAAEPGPLARVVHKALDRKYAGAIRRFRGARGEADIAELWRESRARGDVPGPYWALLTHPDTTDALTERAFGEVHMLSHLVGASNRADIRRLEAMCARLSGLEGEIAGLRRRLAERDLRIEAMRKQAEGLARRAGEAERLREHLNERAGARERTAGHGRALAAARATVRARDGQIADLKRRCREAERGQSRLAAECRALQGALDAATQPVAAAQASLASLGGKRVLYLGGRARVLGHLRAIVERHDGAFLHHDGGKEERLGRLDEVIGQADLVLCPVDRVSHGASLKAKSFCKRAGKPFIPLRSSSLSSLALALAELGAPVKRPA